MADEVTSSVEPVFRATKRRKIFRKRTDDEHEVDSPEAGSLGKNAPVGADDEESGHASTSRVTRPVARRNNGVAFRSGNIPKPEVDTPNEEMALIPMHPDREQKIAQVDRFVKPTGKVAAVADDKHMFVLPTMREET